MGIVGVVSPRRAITRAQPPFFSTAINILLIKSNVKFESRATAVSVSMSSRYLGGKYRSRLHTRSRKCTCQFLCVKSNCAKPASSASRGYNEVDRVVCLKVEFQMHTVLSDENGNYDISVLQQVGMFFDGIACLMKVWPCSSGSSLVSRWRDAPLVREFQMWRRRCKQIDPHWFQGRQMRFWRMLSTISWK